MLQIDLDVFAFEIFIQHDDKKKGRTLEGSISSEIKQLRITHGMRHRNISWAERQNTHQEGRKKQFDEGFKVARKIVAMIP